MSPIDRSDANRAQRYVRDAHRGTTSGDTPQVPGGPTARRTASSPAEDDEQEATELPEATE